MPDYYTRYPRTLLWLVRGGEIEVGGEAENALPRSKVEVPSFYISKFPITNRQFQAFDSSFVRSEESYGDDDPAIPINWEQAEAYAAWYAEIARKQIRLPSEVEWEYACRAGSLKSCPAESDDRDEHIWHAGNSGDRIPPLDAKKANSFGLYAMLGGVWEWTSSDFHLDPRSAEKRSPHSNQKVLRGGSYRTPLAEISCSLRKGCPPNCAAPCAGFRVVREFSIKPSRP